MKIRTRLSLLAVGVALLFTLGLVAVLAIVIVKRFDGVELDLARADNARVAVALRSELSRIGAFTRDYARWDDTWRFARGGNPGFPEANLTEGTYANAHLHLIAIYDGQGKLLFELSGNREGPLERLGILPDRLDDGGALEATVASEEAYLLAGGGVLLAAAAPILHSDLSGPAAGVLVMGRLLDDAFIEELGAATGVSVEFSFLPPGQAEPAEPSGPEPPEFHADPDGRYLLGTRLFRTAMGEPAFLLTTRTPRSLSTVGAELARILATLSLAISGLLVLVSRRALRDWVTLPLARFEKVLDALDLDGPVEPDPVLRELASRPDEIGHVAFVLAAMNERIMEAHEAVRRGSEELETRIRERTSELEEANQALSLQAKILESASEAIIVTDLEGRIVDLNESATTMSGWSRAELIGQNPRIMKSGRHPPEFYESMWRSIREEGRWAGEIWNHRRDGSLLPLWLSIRTIHDGEGKALSYAGISTDISQVKAAEEKAFRLAYYDSLTGLPNRSLFNDRLAGALSRARRRSGQMALMFIDLDRFKNVNDSLGHAVGDSLLVQVARRLRERLRETDTVSRLGGDEFTVILEEVAHGEDAGRLAQSIMRAMEAPFAIEGTEIYGSMSLGISVFPRDGEDAETLVKKADAAMYLAKESGRGTWRFASRDMDERGRRRIDTETRLHGALERDEFRLWYQPQAAAAQAGADSPAGLVGAEALIRWVQSDGRVIGPGDFMDIAEETGLVLRMGAWAIAEACREARRWLDAGKPLQVSVNVSIRQFSDGRLPATVAAALSATGLPAALLKLEVTESMFTRNMGAVVDTIGAIREMGVSFAIDDFGTGYSSLQYLNRLPVDCLKIDKAFVTSMSEGRSGGEIVTAVIAMARAFGMRSVAEGVETAAQLEELRRRGCDTIQGYLVSRPLPAAGFAAFAGIGGTAGPG